MLLLLLLLFQTAVMRILTQVGKRGRVVVQPLAHIHRLQILVNRVQIHGRPLRSGVGVVGVVLGVSEGVVAWQVPLLVTRGWRLQDLIGRVYQDAATGGCGTASVVSLMLLRSRWQNRGTVLLQVVCGATASVWGAQIGWLVDPHKGRFCHFLRILRVSRDTRGAVH